MAQGNFSERVMAAYGLDDEEVDISDCDRVSSTRGPLNGKQTPSVVSSRPTEHSIGTKVSSYNTSFDPEDQSDDEVVIASIYNREVQAGRAVEPSHNGKGLRNAQLFNSATTS